MSVFVRTRALRWRSDVRRNEVAAFVCSPTRRAHAHTSGGTVTTQLVNKHRKSLPEHFAPSCRGQFRRLSVLHVATPLRTRKGRENLNLRLHEAVKRKQDRPASGTRFTTSFSSVFFLFIALRCFFFVVGGILPKDPHDSNNNKKEAPTKAVLAF